MKFQDCNFDIGGVSMALPARNEPEQLWLEGKSAGSIPPALFELYRRADYFFVDAAPRFMKDPDDILFTYFCMMVRSLASLLIHVDRDNKAFIEADRNEYYPGKTSDDPSWTKAKSESAAELSRQLFRNLLIALHAALDTLSEIVAIFSQGAVKKLEVGLAQFYSIDVWLKSDYRPPGNIRTSRDLYLEELHAKMKPLVHCQAPESGWLPYMRLMRNKAAHLGDGPLRFVKLPGKDEKFYTFAPRVWPYIWERDIKPAGQEGSRDIRDHLSRILVHQDVVEYMQGAARKVKAVVEVACDITANAYTRFRDFEFNQVALDELGNNLKECEFLHFVDQ